jgi:hypothetical protein
MRARTQDPDLDEGRLRTTVTLLTADDTVTVPADSFTVPVLVRATPSMNDGSSKRT